MRLGVGDMGLCPSGTPYHARLASLDRDLLGGMTKLDVHTLFLVLEVAAVGSGGQGIAYRCAFCGFRTLVGWVNAVFTEPIEAYVSEEG